VHKTPQPSARSFRYSPWPQAFPTAAPHINTILWHISLSGEDGTHPRPEMTSSLSQKILLSGSHTLGERSGTHNERGETVEDMQVCPSLTP